MIVAAWHQCCLWRQCYDMDQQWLTSAAASGGCRRSISLNVDSYFSMKEVVARAEAELGEGRGAKK